MIGDFTMAPMTVNRTRESYEYDADGYLIAVRASQQVLSRTAGVDTLVYAGPESLTATTSYDGDYGGGLRCQFTKCTNLQNLRRWPVSRAWFFPAFPVT